jgi:hypothetical protein
VRKALFHFSHLAHKSLRHATFVELHLLYLLYLLYLLLIVIVIAGEKKCSKTGHRLRPPASVVLDFHGGLRCQQLLGALHVAVACCRMQRSPTSAPAEWRSRLRDRRRSLSSPRRVALRTSTAAPFATRNATTARWPRLAAQCSADRSPKTRSRQPRSRRRWPRTAGRSPLRAAWAMSSSRRAEE